MDRFTMDENKLKKYKTVMCQRMLRSGACRYGVLCDFAHDEAELRRNLNQVWYYGVKCDKENCADKECRFAHNDMEVMYHPHIYKTKLCQHYTKSTGCPKKNYCSFAHGRHELRQPKFSGPDIDGTTAPPSEQNGSSPVLPDAYKDPLSNGDFFQNNDYPTSSSVSPPESPFPVPPNPLIKASDGTEFRDTTDALKIRILDIVDEISRMHYDRASFQISSQLEQRGKTIQELTQRLAQSELIAAELKHDLDVWKGLTINRMSLAELDKYEEEHTRVIQSIRQARAANALRKSSENNSLS